MIRGMRILVFGLLASLLCAGPILAPGTATAVPNMPGRAPVGGDLLQAPPTVLAADDYRHLVETAESAPPPSNSVQAAVIARLEDWAAAWSRQDTEAYLSFYAEDFTPSGRLSRSGWEAERDQRLGRPAWIAVRLSDFDVRVEAPDRVRVELTQAYRSDVYGDRTRKQFILGLRDGEWRIVSERSLKILSR